MRRVFDTIVRSVLTGSGPIYTAFRFLLPLVIELLQQDEPLRKEAAGKIFNRVCSQLYQLSTEAVLSNREVTREYPNIVSFLKLAKQLKKKEDGILLFSAFSLWLVNWCDGKVIQELVRFVAFAGWSSCQGVIDTILQKLHLNDNNPSTVARFLLT